MVKTEMKRREVIARKKIGDSSLGTMTDFALQTALEGYGVKNVKILQMGGQPEEMTGLLRGVVDGAVLSPPYNFQLKKQGYNELVSPSDLSKLGEFITNGITARRGVAEKDKETGYRGIQLTAESIKFLQSNRDATKKIITKWMPLKDADLLEDHYRFPTADSSKEGGT